MTEGPPSIFKPLTWAELRRTALVMIPVFWLMGFCLGLPGSDANRAAMKATAYTLSGVAGCCVYLRVWWPKNFFDVPWILFTMGVPLLQETRTPWPFLSRLTFGVAANSLLAFTVALLQRLWSRWGEWANAREAERAARPPERLRRPEPPPPVVSSDFEPAIRGAGTR